MPSGNCVLIVTAFPSIRGKRCFLTIMIKRSFFTSKFLPYFLILPQVLVTVTFFYWPALQGLAQSVMRSDPFGQRNTFIWLENFIALFNDPLYLKSIGTTLVFSACVGRRFQFQLGFSLPPWLIAH